jgi:primosomal protein N''
MGCMDSPGTLLTILVLLVGLFATAGYGLMSVAQYRAARGAFALTAFCLAAIGVELGLVMAWPLPAKILVAGCFGFLAAGGLVYSINSISLLDKPNGNTATTTKWYSTNEASKLVDALGQDEGLLIKLLAAIQPTIGVFNPTFWQKIFDFRDPTGMVKPEQQYIGQLNYILKGLIETQANIAATRDSIIQIHNSLGWSLSKEVSNIPNSLDDPALSPAINDFKSAVLLLIHNPAAGNNSVASLVPQNRRFVEALFLYSQQLESTLGDVRAKIDIVRRSVQLNSEQDAIFRAEDLAKQLRTLDARQSQTWLDTTTKLPKLSGITSEEEKNRIWQENTKALDKIYTDQKIDFVNRLRPEIIRVRDDLLYRIKLAGKVPPEPTQKVQAVLDRGQLAGAGPLLEVADYLESLANLLRT